MLYFAYASFRLRSQSPASTGEGVRHLPLLHANVEGPGGKIPFRFRLDTGSDQTILPQALASVLGVDLAAAPLAEAQSASGTVIRYPCAQVILRISDGVEFCTWEAQVGFVDVQRGFGLAGLAGFLDHFNLHLLGHDHEFTLHPNAAFPGQHGTH